jgi:hypothetical protein
MARARIQREFPTALMENPLYFTLLLQRRLEISNFFSQRSVHYRICAYNRDLRSEECNLGEFNKSMHN